MTCSIIAFDPESQCVGIASQSHFFAVGSRVVAARPGDGAVLAQASIDSLNQVRILAELARGESPDVALARALEQDSGAQSRQIAVMNHRGESAVHTGTECLPARGQCVINNAVTIANMCHPGVADVMASAFEQSEGEFSSRLLLALHAGQDAGGDLRGKQSATMRIIAPDDSDPLRRGVLTDIRVDDHGDPLGELGRLLNVELASEVLWRALREPALRSESNDVSDSDRIVLERRLAELVAARIESNHEFIFWESVLLAKLGRTSQAASLLSTIAAASPGWRQMAQGVVDRGWVSPAFLASHAPE